MKEKVKSLIGEVLNPITGVNLEKEGRLIDLEISTDNKGCKIKYSRDGIDSENKLKIENAIYDTLSKLFDEENISLLSFSKNSKDVYNGDPTPKDKTDAELKIGHGTIGQKKKIPHVKKVLAVASGKGGVGKSTFAVNLAMALLNNKKKVGIIDADIYGPSIPMLLNQRDARPSASDKKKILPIKSLGIYFMSFGLFIDEKDPVIWRGPMLGGVLNQFLFDVDWGVEGDLDYLIIDLPPGTGDMQLSMAQSVEIDGTLIISTPQDVALLDAKKGLNMFRKVNVPVIGMVENMSSFICDDCEKEHFIFGKDGVSKACQELETDYLGGIPLDIGIQVGSDKGTPFMSEEKNKNKKAYSSYMEIAGKIDEKFFNEVKPLGFIKNLFR
jgi:ATP-binding protein involved in chromosome partitioning